MLKTLLSVFGIFIVLTAVTTIAMNDFSPRHTLFLLADAILLTAGAKLMQEAKSYYRVMAAAMVVLCSVFVIRYVTPTAVKVWDVNIYFSFCLALVNIVLLISAILPRPVLQKLFLVLAGAALFAPILLCWGYYATELSWLNVDAIMAVLQTNSAEALEYVKDRTGGYSVLLALLFAAGLAVWVKLASRITAAKKSWKRIAGIVFFLVLNAVLVFRTGDNFVTSIFRETTDYQKNYNEYARQKEIRKQNLSHIMLQNNTGRKGIYFLVIGESQNTLRMSAYGYKLKTTPWLDSMKNNPNLLLFQHAYACQVQTVPALSYALTAKNQYNSVKMEQAVSLIDVAKAAGYQAVWLSNQVRFGGWGTPVTVIAEEADQKIWINSHQGNTLDTEYYDGELINRLQDIKRSDKMLIVVHLMGNHISYHSRYPAEFDKFKAEGKRSEYDNSILYNDYVMQQLIDKVSQWPEFQGLLYFSDHGESVEQERGHNPDRFVFEMAYIPMYMYFSPAYISANEKTFRVLQASQAQYFTNDLIFNTMLGIMDIRNEAFYEAENDLASPAYNGDVNRLKTLYGKRSIAEDVAAR
ncbi:heptose-I-phosphate ethanolaminephosphotransferase [Succiniclasticum ruminis]|uniref:Heptose-I-phosphate ethanolaminephosphotransferase n=1 Tax=Succiniclasticum ruminis TaxID=40841 RepID=A0A1G6HM78_9FIRM|nr:phosphoethanolamine transferase [Succiniclasticum ruminis]SDB95228.1 heptose-I-phosphate ethanolaminephosphotransferase [Succiniclasticum ruminis]